MSILSERLILLRENAGMSQYEVAKLLQIERSTYSNYENKHREPNLQILENIAKLYSVPVSYLLGDIDIFSDSPHSHYANLPPSITKEDLDLLHDINQLSTKQKLEIKKWIQKNKQDNKRGSD